jgi:hypothetical protein
MNNCLILKRSGPDRGCDACCVGRCSIHSNTLGYKVTRSLTSSQGTALLSSLSDLTRPWEFLSRIYKEGLDIGWLTSNAYGGEVFVTPKDRLQS